jgi:hypothetical protein
LMFTPCEAGNFSKANLLLTVSSDVRFDEIQN